MNPFSRGRPQKGKPPKGVAGEYRIRTKITKIVVYVGISCDLQKRFKEHLKSGKFRWWQHDFEWMPASEGASWDDLRDHEKNAINKYKPRKNQKGGGGGRIPNMFK